MSTPIFDSINAERGTFPTETTDEPTAAVVEIDLGE